MADLSGLGADSCAVWTRGQALRLLRAGEVDSRVRTREWQGLWRGVYADGGFAPTPVQRAGAALLAAGGEVLLPTQRRRGGHPPRAVVAGRTAARLWQVPLLDDDDPATGALDHLHDDIAVDRHVRAQVCAGRTLHPHQLALGADEVVRLSNGLLLTSCLRTLVDLASLVTHEAHVCALDDALRRELVTREDLQRAVDDRRGSRWAPALAAAVDLADGRAESPAETLARLLLLPELPQLQPQVRLVRHGRVLARFDLADEGARFAVEADGKRGHAGPAMAAHDRRRDRASASSGWTTERVTWFELRRQQRALVARVRESYDAHLDRRRRLA